MTTKDNIAQIREHIARACARIHRDPDAIELIGVTKNRQIGQINEIIACGINQLGENKVQEAAAKYSELGNQGISWHLIGHLQTNKVKDAVRIFDLIQSVDSVRLAEEIDKQAAKVNKIQEILLEVKTSFESTKSGLSLDDFNESFKAIVKLQNIRIKGLMTIAPLVAKPEKARPYFRALRELREQLYRRPEAGDPAQEFGAGRRLILSMGMTDDFEVAIEEGTDMVRLGRALFE
jgi:PLP dependent protein